ncbi:hypothetical protein J1605_016774 [Eschrichtius robustus]|uniref:Basic proline-rich protein n=1 Tax=Eschrichtius robustus TaxID=9764 RepID=A0AB34I072_ESCRO|nr:hypothetical protein J1605_016774 [Eschrichtius robustus]
MSASEQASEPSSSSSSSSRSPPLPPPLPPPPPPRPPVAAEGRGAQAARAAAVWARIREAPRSGGRGGDGSPHLHAISMRPARGPPPPAPPLARLICMHIPHRHIPGLNPAAPAARCACRGAGPRKPQDFREERGGEALFGRQGPSKPRRHKGSPAPPRTPGRSGRWESVKSRASARKRVSGASGAVSPPGPLQGARPSVTSASRRKAKADPAVRGRRDTPGPVPRCGGEARARLGEATAPPPPTTPRRGRRRRPPRAGLGRSTRGPRAGRARAREPAPSVRPRLGKSPTRSPAEAQKVWANPLAGKRGGPAARLS